MKTNYQKRVFKSIWFLTLFLLSNQAIFAQNLVRGPYLQMGTQTSVVIRWRTDAATTSKVNYGTFVNQNDFSKTDFTPKTEHELVLTNLQANTKYYYTIGDVNKVLQGDANNFFFTNPSNETKQKIRFLALGDCGSANEQQKKVRDEFLKYSQNNPFHLTLLLGDNAYTYGKDDEYQSEFFNTYQGNLLKNSIVYPNPGNHDYYSMIFENGIYKGAYFDIFTVPTKAEAGGVASNTEAYYSYDYGNIHFVSLDSYGKENNETQRLYDTLSPQVEWLKSDLAQNKNKWTVVYFHYPPYDKVDYDSDKEVEFTKIRENFLRILERNGVDLVLCGHSHAYQRSYLMRRHYGKAATFRAKLHGVSMSSGKYDGSANSCPYVKKNGSGTVYVVSGSSSIVRDRRAADYPHPAMNYSNFDKTGALIIEVEDNRLDAKWLCEDGVIRDNFTIFKDVNKIENLSVRKGENIDLKASWNGSHIWENGKNTQQIRYNNTIESSKIYVSDDKRCLADTFKITLSNGFFEESQINLFPNPAKDFIDISFEIPIDGNYEIQLSDSQGKLLKTFQENQLKEGNQQKRIPLDKEMLQTELILITISSGNYRTTKKVQLIR